VLHSGDILDRRGALNPAAGGAYDGDVLTCERCGSTCPNFFARVYRSFCLHVFVTLLRVRENTIAFPIFPPRSGADQPGSSCNGYLGERYVNRRMAPYPHRFEVA
jgi:hypothetical protein